MASRHLWAAALMAAEAVGRRRWCGGGGGVAGGCVGGGGAAAGGGTVVGGSATVAGGAVGAAAAAGFGLGRRAAGAAGVGLGREARATGEPSPTRARPQQSRVQRTLQHPRPRDRSGGRTVSDGPHRHRWRRRLGVGLRADDRLLEDVGVSLRQDERQTQGREAARRRQKSAASPTFAAPVGRAESVVPRPQSIAPRDPFRKHRAENFPS